MNFKSVVEILNNFAYAPLFDLDCKVFKKRYIFKKMTRTLLKNFNCKDKNEQKSWYIKMSIEIYLLSYKQNLNYENLRRNSVRQFCLV